MNSDADHRPATDHEQLLSEVAELAVDRGLDIATPDRIAEFLQHYFKHADSSTLLARPAGLIAGALLHHAKLAWWRLPGESHVELFTPSLYSDGWDAGGQSAPARQPAAPAQRPQPQSAPPQQSGGFGDFDDDIPF